MTTTIRCCLRQIPSSAGVKCLLSNTLVEDEAALSAMKPPTPMTVLCVEDEDEQLGLRKMIFEAAGFQFIGARTGAEALELLRTREIGAAVLDYWMSGMNGMALATEMKRQQPSIPVVMLSGFASLPGEGVGVVDACLQKARVEPESLIEQVRELIKRNAAGDDE